MKMEQSVPETSAYKIQSRGIIQKKIYNIHNTAKVWSQELSKFYMFCCFCV
jgi:hypothetical protein